MVVEKGVESEIVGLTECSDALVPLLIRVMRYFRTMLHASLALRNAFAVRSDRSVSVLFGYFAFHVSEYSASRISPSLNPASRADLYAFIQASYCSRFKLAIIVSYSHHLTGGLIMWKTAIVILFITSSATAGDFAMFCPTDPDPNYGEHIVPIPMGVVHFTETMPRYCHVHHETGSSYCMFGLESAGSKTTDGPVFQIMVEGDNPHIIMGERLFVPCKSSSDED
ncbi:MAG: hypothetical protein NXI27_25975 [Alphaproteobacteria bacterium]|nr:hypothetical protein [Alphaproteobacteria bacterium]